MLVKKASFWAVERQKIKSKRNSDSVCSLETSQTTIRREEAGLSEGLNGRSRSLQSMGSHRSALSKGGCVAFSNGGCHFN